MRQKRKLSPHAQTLILELAMVNEIVNRVYHANAFILQSLRLRLEIEEVWK